MFSHLGARTDLASRRLPSVFQILRRQSDGAERVQHDVRSDVRVAVHHDMRDQLRTILDHHVGADRAVRAYANSNAKFGASRDDGSAVNECRLSHNHFGHCIHIGGSLVRSCSGKAAKLRLRARLDQLNHYCRMFPKHRVTNCFK